MHVINAQKWTWCDRKHLSILRLCEKSETAAGQLYPLLPAREENISICRCHLGAAPQLYRCLLRGLFLAFISHGSFKSPHLIALRFPSQTLCVLQMHKTRSQHLRCPWVWTSHGIAADLNSPPVCFTNSYLLLSCTKKKVSFTTNLCNTGRTNVCSDREAVK